MVGLYIFGGILILLSIVLLVSGIRFISEEDDNGFFLVYMGIIFALIGILMIFCKDNPTKQDVIDGKAVYQETQIITGNDTIKTYEIVWK